VYLFPPIKSREHKKVCSNYKTALYYNMAYGFRQRQGLNPLQITPNVPFFAPSCRAERLLSFAFSALYGNPPMV